jgi:hypothetical protein
MKCNKTLFNPAEVLFRALFLLDPMSIRFPLFHEVRASGRPIIRYLANTTSIQVSHGSDALSTSLSTKLKDKCFSVSATQSLIGSNVLSASRLSPATFNSKERYREFHNSQRQVVNIRLHYSKKPDFQNEETEFACRRPPTHQELYLSLKQTQTSTSSIESNHVRNAHLPLHPIPPDRCGPSHLTRSGEPNQRFHTSPTTATATALLSLALEAPTRGKARTDQWLD